MAVVRFKGRSGISDPKYFFVMLCVTKMVISSAYFCLLRFICFIFVIKCVCLGLGVG